MRKPIFELIPVISIMLLVLITLYDHKVLLLAHFGLAFSVMLFLVYKMDNAEDEMGL